MSKKSKREPVVPRAFSRDAYGHGLENKNNGTVQILDNLIKEFYCYYRFEQ